MRSNSNMTKPPELWNVLQLGENFFTVRPHELVRKAIDELTLGLQFYVLFAISHSAIKETSSWKENPISFKYKKSPKFKDEDSFEEGTETGEIEMPKPFVRSTFKKQVRTYFKTAATKDFRCLLNHIKEVSKTDDGKEYYDWSMVKTVYELSRCARYFFHRNYLVVDEEPSSKNFYESINENQMNVAKIFFANDFFDNLPKQSDESYNRHTIWERNFCEKLKLAAFDYFKNAQIIQKKFNREFNKMYYEEASNSNQNENTKKSIERMVRYEISFKNDELIIKKKYDKSDTIGVSHLDVINRAIDISQLALRRILHEALIDEQALRIDVRRNRDKVLKSLFELKNIFGIYILVKERISDTNVYCFQEDQMCEEVKLVKEFNQRFGLASYDFTNFMYLDGHFADPRFIGVFLIRQSDTFPLAKNLVRIRDNASHQINLHRTRNLTLAKLKQDIIHLKDLVDQVAENLGITHFDYEEFKALEQLYNIIQEYPKYKKLLGFTVDISAIEMILKETRIMDLAYDEDTWNSNMQDDLECMLNQSSINSSGSSDYCSTNMFSILEEVQDEDESEETE